MIIHVYCGYYTKGAYSVSVRDPFGMYVLILVLLRCSWRAERAHLVVQLFWGDFYISDDTFGPQDCLRT